MATRKRKPTIKPPCLMRMSAEEYHADPCPVPSLSHTIAHTLVSDSPIHAYLAHPRLGSVRKEPTKAMDKGTLGHILLLDEGRDIRRIDADDWRTQAARDERDSWRAAGGIAALEHEYQTALDAAHHVRLQLEDDFDVKLDGVSEVAAFWYETADDGTRVLCRAMLDHWIAARAIAYDVKIPASSHPKACQSFMIDHGCDIQWAAYTSALGKIFPELAGRVDLEFLFCEFDAPFCVTPVEVAGSMRELGARKWRRAINTWAACTKSEKWPGYVSKRIRVEAPAWALQQEELLYG